jgi:hypothetical protein
MGILTSTPTVAAKTRFTKEYAETLPLISQEEADGKDIVCEQESCFRKASLKAEQSTTRLFYEGRVVPRHRRYGCSFHENDPLHPAIKVRLWDHDAPESAYEV